MMGTGFATRLLDGVVRFTASLFGFGAHSPSESRELLELQHERRARTDEDLWSVEYDVVGFEGVERAFKTFLRLNRKQLVHAFVDAISSDKKLPHDVEAARQALLRIGEEREGRRVDQKRRWWQPGGDPQMAIELDLRDDEHFRLFETFGAYSIHAEGYYEAAEDNDYCVNVHDSGTVLLVQLEDPEAFRAAADLSPQALVDLPTARELAKAQRKRRK